jgi:NTE family protein
VSGTSIGALVGAAYASGRLDPLEEWVARIDWWEIIRYMDMSRGGVEGERLMRAFGERVEDVPIETLPKPFGAVATDLLTGREVWFQNGSLLEAVRASIALPGLFSPVRFQERWLVDGGLVDPLPVSLCRALGRGTGDRGESERRYRRPASARAIDASRRPRIHCWHG